MGGAAEGPCMTAEQRWLFDTQGFLHLRAALDPAELASRKALWRQILLDAQAYGRARREAMRQEELRRAAAAALRDAMSSSGVTSLDLTALGGGCMHADADAEETEEEEDGPPSPVLDL